MRRDGVGGTKRQRDELREAMQGQHRTREEIAVAMSRLWFFRPRPAWRHAYGWTQEEVAHRYNRLIGNVQGAMTAKRISDHEKWPHGGAKPTISFLGVLAEIYGASVSQLVDHSDRQALDLAELFTLDALPSTLASAHPANNYGVVLGLLPGAPSNSADRELISSSSLTNRSTQDPMRTVFISYRRAETSHIAGRLYDWLTRKIGDERVFMDVDSIELGANFAQVVVDAAERCTVLLAVIGHRWEDVIDKDGRRRLSKPNDLVRLEIEAALKRGVRIIPVLVDRVDMPSAQDLPPTLRGIARLNAPKIRHESFKDDMGRLLRAIERALS